MRLIKINSSEVDYIKRFLEIAGDSLKSFRYYNSRPLSVINNHIVTLILIEDDLPIGYGHLDKEDEVVWLGIAICDKYKGKGLGVKIMDRLIEHAKMNYLKEINLSVDSENTSAVNLYKKFGFLKMKEQNNTLYFKLVIDN